MEIQELLVKRLGATVRSGPFAGMQFLSRSIEGCLIPKLLGIYEQELHPFIESIPSRNYETILNIGFSEGYYAVGLKRLCPTAQVYAFDLNRAAHAICRDVAARNGVDVSLGGEFRIEDFSRYAGRTLVWCDIEGAEIDLLDPDKAPALLAMDLVVELHPTPKGHSRDILSARFAASHDIEILNMGTRRVEFPEFLNEAGDLDRLLAMWEWRGYPTPWAVMHARSSHEPVATSSGTT